MGFTIDSNVKGVGDRLNAIVRDLANLNRGRLVDVAHIMRAGVFQNFETLKWGNSVADWQGNMVSWPKSRYVLTSMSRRRMGIGGEGVSTLPMLETTEGPILAENFQNGNIEVFSAGDGSNLELTGQNPALSAFAAEHQFGDTVLAKFRLLHKKDGDARTANLKLPSRPFVFWSRSMLNELLDVVHDEFDRSVGRNA